MNDLSDQNSYDAAVIGGGPAGLATAIALTKTDAKTALIARRAPYRDNRTTALLDGSIDLLQKLQVWQRCEAEAAPLRVMRLVDDTHRLIRAPEVKFSSDEIGLEAFGYNLENRVLLAAMEQAAHNLTELTWVDDEAEAITSGEQSVAIRTAGGKIFHANVVVGADGRRSMARQAAGILTKSRQLPQSAVTFNISHTRPHLNISTEFHTQHGPCVFVPLPGDRSSVVWVTTPDEAQRTLTLDDGSMSDLAERQSHSILGRLTVEGGRHAFPLVIERSTPLASNRIALVGEAAHVLPPFGAQGLNMGLRDAADIAGCVGDALARGDDPGSDQVLRQYCLKRNTDVVSRSFMIDVANRSLLNDFLPLQAARALGLHFIGSIGPLRRRLMREGLSPPSRAS